MEVIDKFDITSAEDLRGQDEDLNTICFSGRVTKIDGPSEVRSGKMVLNLSVGINSLIRPTTWIPVVMWEEDAEKWGAELEIGDRIMVEGVCRISRRLNTGYIVGRKLFVAPTRIELVEKTTNRSRTLTWRS